MNKADLYYFVAVGIRTGMVRFTSETANREITKDAAEKYQRENPKQTVTMYIK